MFSLHFFFFFFDKNCAWISLYFLVEKNLDNFIDYLILQKLFWQHCEGNIKRLNLNHTHNTRNNNLAKMKDLDCVVLAEVKSMKGQCPSKPYLRGSSTGRANG